MMINLYLSNETVNGLRDLDNIDENAWLFQYR